MSVMTDDERDAFLLERRLGTLAVARAGKGPLTALTVERWRTEVLG